MELQLNNQYYNIKSVVPHYPERIQEGEAVIKRNYVDHKDEFYHNLGCDEYFQKIKQGHYAVLFVNGELMMSDTPMERRTNEEFVNHANGRVMIAGLGLGMIVFPLLEREDVITLVSQKVSHPKVKIIQGDIFEVKLNKGEKFDTIYFDIWPSISSENLSEMTKLHHKFKNFLNRDNPRRWMSSWTHKYLQKKRRREKKEEEEHQIWVGYLNRLNDSNLLKNT